MVQEPLSGLSIQTPDNLVLDAGVIYANIDIEELEDPAGGWSAAIQDAELLGATRSGASFNANRENREVDVNGTLGPVRGLVYRNEIRPTLSATFLEMKSQNLIRWLNGNIEQAGKFDRISGNEINDGNYFDNIALAATKIGSEEPIVFVLMNVLVHTSPDFSLEDHNELTAEVEFVGHFPLSDPRNETAVWRVYNPVEES